MDAVGGEVLGQQAAYAGGAAVGAAQVISPHHGGHDVAIGIQDGQGSPSVIDEAVGAGGGARVGPNGFLDAAALVVVGEGHPARVPRNTELLRHRDEAVVGIPGVGPAAVGEQVAVGVVGEAFRGLRHKQAPRNGRVSRNHRQVRPHRVRGVAHRPLLPEILPLPEGGALVHAHRVVRHRQPQDVHVARHGAERELVEKVVGVNGRPQIRCR